MNYVEKVKEFILTFPDIGELIHIDSNDIDAVNYGLYSNGQTIISNEKDILGNTVIGKQLNLTLNVLNVTKDDIIRLDNLNFLQCLIEFVETSNNKPVFGDFPDRETFQLSNNMLLEDDGTIGSYQLQINITFYKEVKYNG